MSYQAIVAKLENVRKHSNADRLQIANCLGYQVIVGLEAKDGDVVILFPDDGQLSHEYIYNNNLYNKPEQNKDANARTGFFDHKRRVRCQTFRGEKSEAYTASLDSLAFTDCDISSLTIGAKFDVINDIPICNKYITEATKASSNQGKTQTGYNKAALKKLFPEHMDTDQIRFALDSDLVGLVTITRKMHGTSARTGYIKFPEKQSYSFWQKVKAAICHEVLPEYINKWQIIQGTRRVIKGKVKDGNQDFRSNCSRILAPYIKKGEIWYYEIVGYEETGAQIMPSVSTDKMPKEFVKQFGNTMTYKYGCLPRTCDIYVYRITVQNEDNEVYELPWSMVKERCNRAGVKHVPEIAQYITDEGLMVHDFRISKYDEDWCDIREIIEYYTEEVDLAESVDVSHIREGICVRVENLKTGKIKIWKNKTFAFKVLEGIIKDSDVVDMEEAESLGDE